MTELKDHMRHMDTHGRPIRNWFCCGLVQLGGIGMEDCNVCGEWWPCQVVKDSGYTGGRDPHGTIWDPKGVS